MVWSDFTVENRTDLTIVECNFKDLYKCRSKSPLQMVVDPGQSHMSTLAPRSGFMWVECGVGGVYEFEVLRGTQSVGKFKITIRVPACGDNTFTCDWLTETPGVAPVLQHRGKGGTENAHRHYCTLNTSGRAVLKANTADRRLQSAEYLPLVGYGISIGHATNAEHNQAKRAAVAGTAGTAAAVASIATSGAVGAGYGVVAAEAAGSAVGGVTKWVAAEAASSAVGGVTKWGCEKAGNAVVEAEARTAGDTSLQGLATSVGGAAGAALAFGWGAGQATSTAFHGICSVGGKMVAVPCHAEKILVLDGAETVDLSLHDSTVHQKEAFLDLVAAVLASWVYTDAVEPPHIEGVTFEVHQVIHPGANGTVAKLATVTAMLPTQKVLYVVFKGTSYMLDYLNWQLEHDNATTEDEDFFVHKGAASTVKQLQFMKGKNS